MEKDKIVWLRLKQTKEEILGEISELRDKAAAYEQHAKLLKYQIELYQDQLLKGNYYK